MNKKISLFLVACAIVCCFLNQPVFAGGEYYVNSNCLYKGDGSKEQPFNKISQAVEVGAKNIFISNGVYKEDLVLNDVKIIGESLDNTIIEGVLDVSDSVTLENLSINPDVEKLGNDKFYYDGVFGVHINEGGSVFAKNISISECWAGVVIEDSSSLHLDSSKIFSTDKAVYVKKRGSSEITNSDIFDNMGEGIDVRGDTTNVILNNNITNNGESGIEIVVGGVNADISNNNISGNHASGINIQYYEDFNYDGNFKVVNNKILNNDEYGFACKRPSGGSPGSEYWSNSVKEIRENIIRDNKNSDFSSSCKFSDELKFNALRTEVVEDEIQKKHYRFFKDEVDRQIKQTAIQNRSKVKTFLIGSDYEKLEELNGKIDTYKEHLNKLDEFSGQTENQKVLELINEDKKKIEELNANIEDFVKTEKEKFSLFGWLFN